MAQLKVLIGVLLESWAFTRTVATKVYVRARLSAVKTDVCGGSSWGRQNERMER